MSDDDQERITLLTDEEAIVVKSIESLEALEQGIARRAAPVGSLPSRGVAQGAHATKEKGGSLFAKVVTAKLFAHEYKQSLDQVIERLYKDDERVRAVTPLLTRSGVAAADTMTGGWAAELVTNDTEAFLADLQPVSVYAALRARGVALNFGGAQSIKIPRRAGGATDDLGGSWVGEGGVIPVKRMALTSQTMNRYKAAVISAWTNELDQRSVPQIEAMVRQGILDDTAKTLDAALLGNSPMVPNVRPAGLLNGVTLTASLGATAAQVIADLKVLFGALQAARVGANPVMIMNSIRLLGLSTITTAAGGFMFRDEIAAGRLLGVPIIASENVPATTVLIVDAGSFAAANDTPEFAISDQATLTMANADGTAPTQAEGAAGVIGTAEQVPPKGGIHVNEDAAQAFAAGYEAVSLFQTYSMAIRMVLPTSWGLTRANTVAGLSGVNW